MWPSTLLLVLSACVCTAHNYSESSSGSSSGGTVDIYNVCPVVVKFSEEQEHVSTEELKANAADAAMSAYFVSHPNITLWDYFKMERKQKREMFWNLPVPERVRTLVSLLINFTADTAIQLAHMIANVVEWIINTIRDPVVGIKQISAFFHEFGENIKQLWKLMKKEPGLTAKNMGGGLLLHITHHPTEFTAESVLMVTTGFAVIHGLMHGVEILFGSMSSVVSNVLLSVLMFIHAIDDPIYIVTPLLTSIVDTATTIASANSTSDEVLTVTPDIIKPLDTCRIPHKYRPQFSSRDLCLSTPAEVRQLIFGTFKRSFEMTKKERIAAYNRFHDFVCCYLEDQEFEVNAPDMDPTAFVPKLVPTPVKMSNCSQLLGNYGKSILSNPPADDVADDLASVGLDSHY